MTLGALESCMFSFQLEPAVLMRLPGEQRRFKAGLVVTGGTFRARRALGELPLVNILMAVFAMFMRYGTMEITILVALRAGCLRMLSE